MICENCGRSISVVTDAIVSVNEKGEARTVCKQCAATFGHCPMCQHLGPCAFQEDPDPMPRFITKTWRQQTPIGTQVIQRQVPNADRIKRFCIDGGCKCFHDSGDSPICCRLGTGYATCPNYTETEQYKFVQNFPMQEANEN